MSSEELVKEYKENGHRIQRIKDGAETRKEDVQEERSKIWDIIHAKRDQLDKEEYDLRHDLELREKVIEEETKRQTAPFELQRESVRRIVQFLEVQEMFKPAELKEGMWIPAGEWQDWVYQDDYLKIRLLVHENNKPVNKYTTSVCVDCVFREPLLKLPSSCTALGYFKTVDEAKACAVKKKDKVLRDVIQAVEALRTEYIQVIGAYKLSDFDELFEYSCSDCRATFKKVPGNHDQESVRYEGNTRMPVTVKCDSGRFYRQIMRGL